MAVDDELFDGPPSVVKNNPNRYFDYEGQLLERQRFHALSLLQKALHAESGEW